MSRTHEQVREERDKATQRIEDIDRGLLSFGLDGRIGPFVRGREATVQALCDQLLELVAEPDPPMPPGGLCPDGHGILRFAENVVSYRRLNNSESDGSGSWLIGDDEYDTCDEGEDGHLECPTCLARFALPAEFDWGYPA